MRPGVIKQTSSFKKERRILNLEQDLWLVAENKKRFKGLAGDNSRSLNIKRMICI